MTMKECCKKFVDKLDGMITDSFYDDTDGDYVELYIENEKNEDMKIEIAIDGECFGMSYRDFDNAFVYDGDTDKHIDGIVADIKGIISGELCMVTVYRDEGGWCGDRLVPHCEVTEETLNGIISDIAGDAEDGCAEVVLWNADDYDSYDFRDGRIIK